MLQNNNQCCSINTIFNITISLHVILYNQCIYTIVYTALGESCAQSSYSVTFVWPWTLPLITRCVFVFRVRLTAATWAGRRKRRRSERWVLHILWELGAWICIRQAAYIMIIATWICIRQATSIIIIKTWICIK